MNPAVRPVFPTRADVTDAQIEEYLNNLHTALPGRVQRYDAATQVADVQPLVRHPVPQPDGSYVMEDLPMLPSVPVLFQRIGSWFIAGGLQAGDPVLVVFCERAIGAWWAGDGSPQDPEDVGTHDLSYAVCLPLNMVPRSRALHHAPSARDLVIGSDEDLGVRITLRADGSGDVTTTPGKDWTFNGGSTPVAKEGSVTAGHEHASGGLTAGPFAVAGFTAPATDNIASGAGSQNIKVP